MVKKLTVLLNDDQHELLKAAALVQRKTMADVIRDLIDANIRRGSAMPPVMLALEQTRVKMARRRKPRKEGQG